jgi:hypothetical protein
VQFTGSLVKTFAPAPATLQLTRLILKMMVSAPATRGVQWVDCRISGLSATRAIYESDSDSWIKLHPCSLRLPSVQLTELIFKLLVFAPALGAVYQANFYNVGACTCDRRSEAE